MRERCHEILLAGENDDLSHFRIDLNRLDAAAEYVAEEVLRNYPSLKVPFHSRWRHFTVGGIDRIAALLTGIERTERARVQFDLAVTSVLLDAGAGPRWHWTEASTGRTLTRSEGLAIASLELFTHGVLSSDETRPATG